ncbi:hypothetical protein DENSPDRAFT_686014 [Dentipellis sp. KUC8613]|nr:hypothetical protein DENSPDRAFT_686014 [Dentipellis sp. KUC8613]
MIRALYIGIGIGIVCTPTTHLHSPLHHHHHFHHHHPRCHSFWRALFFAQRAATLARCAYRPRAPSVRSILHPFNLIRRLDLIPHHTAPHCTIPFHPPPRHLYRHLQRHCPLHRHSDSKFKTHDTTPASPLIFHLPNSALPTPNSPLPDLITTINLPPRLASIDRSSAITAWDQTWRTPFVSLRLSGDDRRCALRLRGAGCGPDAV